ncbi:uncharacterized protein LOC141901807 [Tubulanus polymorphus]|uniref:uncharacterized protein LOC141901807 n=1 Tax=Tubulanus polymorphus TaxID=672921 RepID=UPI003DA4EA20
MNSKPNATSGDLTCGNDLKWNNDSIRLNEKLNEDTVSFPLIVKAKVGVNSADSDAKSVDVEDVYCILGMKDVDMVEAILQNTTASSSTPVAGREKLTKFTNLIKEINYSYFSKNQKFSIPIDMNSSFRVVPSRTPNYVYKTVADLAVDMPRFVKLGMDINIPEPKNVKLRKDDVVELLECVTGSVGDSFMCFRRSNRRKFKLNFDCIGNFTVVADEYYYASIKDMLSVSKNLPQRICYDDCLKIDEKESWLPDDKRTFVLMKTFTQRYAVCVKLSKYSLDDLQAFTTLHDLGSFTLFPTNTGSEHIARIEFSSADESFGAYQKLAKIFKNFNFQAKAIPVQDFIIPFGNDLRELPIDNWYEIKTSGKVQKVRAQLVNFLSLPRSKSRTPVSLQRPSSHIESADTDRNSGSSVRTNVSKDEVDCDFSSVEYTEPLHALEISHSLKKAEKRSTDEHQFLPLEKACHVKQPRDKPSFWRPAHVREIKPRAIVYPEQCKISSIKSRPDSENCTPLIVTDEEILDGYIYSVVPNWTHHSNPDDFDESRGKNRLKEILGDESSQLNLITQISDHSVAVKPFSNSDRKGIPEYLPSVTDSSSKQYRSPRDATPTTTATTSSRIKCLSDIPEDISSLSVNEVADVVKLHALHKLSDIILEEKIDGTIFRELTEEMLLDEPFNCNKFQVLKVKKLQIGHKTKY